MRTIYLNIRTDTRNCKHITNSHSKMVHRKMYVQIKANLKNEIGLPGINHYMIVLFQCYYRQKRDMNVLLLLFPLYFHHMKILMEKLAIMLNFIQRKII